MRYRTVALVLVSALAITSCAAGGSAAAGSSRGPAAGSRASRSAATRPAAAQVTQSAAAGSGPCSVTEEALTKAVSDLDVYTFGPFGVALGPTDLGNSTGFVGNPAYAEMTHSEVRIAASMAAVGSLLNITLNQASRSAVGQAVIPYLDGTSGAYEDLTSADGTMADEETIVVALSKAVAAALSVCGPSSTVRYAPAQELAHDQMANLLGGAGNYDTSEYNYTNSGVASYLSQMQGILEQEEQLQALGAQGDGGSCTVSQQMYNLLPEVLGSESGFEQDLRSGSDFGSALQEAEDLQATIDRITSEGLAPPAGAAEAVTRTEQGISAGVTTTNDQISAENALADKAYAMANAIAAIPAAYTGENGSYSGSCKPASWPVQPPAPIQDVSE